MEDDESGRLAGFRARFGTSFDSAKTPKQSEEEEIAEEAPSAAASTSTSTFSIRKKTTKEPTFEDEQNNFAEDDINLLDMISSFGQENSSQGPQTSPKKSGKK